MVTAWIDTDGKVIIDSQGKILLCDVCPCLAGGIIGIDPITEEECAGCGHPIWNSAIVDIGTVTESGLEPAGGTWTLTSFSSLNPFRWQWRGPIFDLPDYDNPRDVVGRWALTYLTDGWSSSPFLLKDFADCRWCLHLSVTDRATESVLDDDDILVPNPYSGSPPLYQTLIYYNYRGLSDTNARSNALCAGTGVYTHLSVGNFPGEPEWVLVTPQ